MATPTAREALRKAAEVGGDALADLLVRKALIPELVEPGEGRVVRFVISTGDVDRDNDVINPKGWDLSAYNKNPVVLWAHDYKALPVGRALSVSMVDGKLVSECEFADHEFADTVYRLVKGGFLKATSVGFRPKIFKASVERDGFDFEQQELMEYSVVPVPANPNALVDMRAAKAAGIDTEPLTRWAKGILTAAVAPPPPEGFKETTQLEDTNRTYEPVLDDEGDPIRWNRSLSKAFDVDGEPVEPSSQFYKWVSRYLDTPVKDLYETGFMVGGARMGAFLSALEDSIYERFKTDALRNIHGASEAPPAFETIQLNSKVSRSFLIEGTRFLSPLADNSTKLVLRAQPSWGGIALSFYAPAARSAAVGDLLTEVRMRASALKFLKGEAFALSGEFLTRGGEGWDDLFLSPAAMEPIRRTATLLAEQGKEMDPRGQILMGPPGTGKTLAGRVLMNDVKEATFIWCSSRDFYRGGMFGGIEMAYDLATENAPSIVFIEDIDSWWDSSTIDLLKTELDGLKQKKGIVTVLTTNHPEDLPEALIDRPGRFHDVLNLDLPDEAVRRRMLDRWVPEAAETVRASLAKETGGLSGAHLRELVRFAQTIRSQDAVELPVALEQALAKVREQRDVIAACRRRPVKMFANTWMTVPAKALSTDHPESHPDCDPDEHGACPVGYERGAGGKCHWVEKPKAEEPVVACRVCSRELPLAMPRVKDELGLVCAPCLVAARWPESPSVVAAGAPAVTTDNDADETSVLDLDDDVAVELEGDPEDDVLDLSPEEVRAALRSAVTSAVSTIVRDETRAALNRARGRVD